MLINTAMCVNAYMKRFVQLPIIRTNNDVYGLRKLFNKVESLIRNLKSLEVDTIGYRALLVPLLIEKIVIKFENDIWELQEMLKILKGGLESKEHSI